MNQNQVSKLVLVCMKIDFEKLVYNPVNKITISKIKGNYWFRIRNINEIKYNGTLGYKKNDTMKSSSMNASYMRENFVYIFTNFYNYV